MSVVKCNLSNLMGANKLKIMDVVRATGLHRTTVTKLYQETAIKVDLDAIGKLCHFFKCGVGDLFEYQKDEQTSD